MTTLEQPKSPSLLRQISHYMGGQVAVMAIGFITMPIVMRLMTPAQYGEANRVLAALMVLVALSKLGLPPAAVRFAGRPEPGQEREETALQSTLLASGLFTSLACAALVAVGAWFCAHAEPAQGTILGTAYRLLLGGRSTAWLFVVASALLVPRTVTAILWSLMRAEERSRSYNTFAILLRYASQALGIGAFVIWRTLMAYFWGTVIAECAVVLWFFAGWWRSHRLSVRLFEMLDFRRAMRYGLPLIALEVTSLLIGYSDKYIIQFLLGDDAVGRYAAGYNVAELLPALLVFPVQMAIMPYCFRLWEKEGMARTQGFVATSASRYALVAFPAIALYCAVSPTVLLIFASKKYIGSVGVIPWVVAGQVLWQGFFPMVGMGYHVRKRTGAFTKVQIVGVVLNVGLNFLLVPRMGILGSAVATFATCVAVVVMTGIGSQHQLHVDWEWGSLLRALTAAVVVGLLMVWLPLGAGVLAALFRVVLGAALYTRLVTPLDGNAQWLALAGMKWLREHGLGGRWMYWLTGLSTARTEPVG